MSDPRTITKPSENRGSPSPSGRRTNNEGPERGTAGAADPLVNALRSVWEKAANYLPEDLLHPGRWDRAKMRQEGKELSYFLRRQVFNQIPGVSALAALIVGGWVASTFTTSPIKARLARWGFIKGGKHVVSSSTHQFLSVVLPILVAAVTAYVVQKVMKNVRERQMKTNMAKIAQLGKDVQALVDEKLAILERARDAGLLSPNEFVTKKANLYAAFSRPPASQIQELLISKLG